MIDPGFFYVPATAYLPERSENVIIQGDPEHQYGADTLLGGAKLNATKAAEWAIYPPSAGRYLLSAYYTSCLSRPVNIEINGVLAMRNAMAAPTHGADPACWRPDGRELIELLVVELNAGENRMRVSTPKPTDFMPHIAQFRFAKVG
jgi:hypothetical protein